MPGRVQALQQIIDVRVQDLGEQEARGGEHGQEQRERGEDDELTPAGESGLVVAAGEVGGFGGWVLRDASWW